MTDKLQQEAREAAELYGRTIYCDEMGGQISCHVEGCEHGYLLGAESRDAEIASLRAKLEAVPVEEIRMAKALASVSRVRIDGAIDAINRWLATVTK